MGTMGGTVSRRRPKVRALPSPLSWPFETSKVVSLTHTATPNKLRKKPMFIKLRKKVMSWLREGDRYQFDHVGQLVDCGNEAEEEFPRVKRRDKEDNPLQSRSVSFNLYSATGGIVIETNRYDDVHDQSIVTMHVVPEDEEIHLALSRIITLEALKR
jgi:hypothetical protein